MISRLSPIAALILVTGLMSAATAAAAPEIHNSAQPAEPPRVVHLSELWRIGGVDDDENLLGVVSDVFADEEGRLYLLDVQLVEVQVYDRDGNYEGSLGKQGDGPGELRSVTDALFMPDGTLGLVQPFPGRIVKVDRDGLPAGEIRLGGDDPTQGGFFALRDAERVGENLVVGGIKITRREKSRVATQFIGRLAPDGAEGVHYLEKTNVREFGRNRIVEADEFFPHGGGWTLSPTGEVVIAPARNEYRLEFHAPAGELLRTITRDYESVKRSDDELAAARAGMTPRRRRNRTAVDLEVAATEPDLIRFHIAADGSLWVLPSRGIRDQAPGIHSTWDIFDSAGHFQRQVSLACDADGREDAVFFPGGDLVVVVRQFRAAMQAYRGQAGADEEIQADEIEATPLEVICYRMEPDS